MNPYKNMKAVTLTLLTLGTAEEIKHLKSLQGAANCHYKDQIYFSHFLSTI